MSKYSSLSLSNECGSEATESSAEVELISLLIEKLPRYTLRCDSNVEFIGYQHSDFQRAEQVQPEASELTDEQINSTFDYLLLCGLRVNQMTETYEDCAAMRLLINEQRSHLELAAQIGKKLLEEKNQMETRVSSLEEHLEHNDDTIRQLKHQLHLKDDMLKMFYSEMNKEHDSEVSTCLNNDNQISLDTTITISDKSFGLSKVNIRKLEDKVLQLEEENINLKNRHTSISDNTDKLETKEGQLVDDCIRHMLDSTKTAELMRAELRKKDNDYLNQQEEITRLLTNKIDMENKMHQMLTDNDLMMTQIRDYQTRQFIMTKELTDLRDRYDECLNLLNEKQDQVRSYRRQLQRDANKAQLVQQSEPQSLAVELGSNDETGVGIGPSSSRTLRRMQQARCVNNRQQRRPPVDLNITSSSSGFVEDMSMSSSLMLTDDADSEFGPGSVADVEFEGEDYDDDEEQEKMGNSLLRRSIRDDCVRRRAGGRHASVTDDSGCADANISWQWPSLQRPQGMVTSTPLSFRMPEKLQLVKPMEGSQTLRAWQNLATPSLTKALFEDQPVGVCFRGQQQQLLSWLPPLSPGNTTGNSSPTASEQSLPVVGGAACKRHRGASSGDDLDNLSDDNIEVDNMPLAVPVQKQQQQASSPCTYTTSTIISQHSSSVSIDSCSSTLNSCQSTTTAIDFSGVDSLPNTSNFPAPYSVSQARFRQPMKLGDLTEAVQKAVPECNTPVNEYPIPKMSVNNMASVAGSMPLSASSWISSLVTSMIGSTRSSSPPSAVAGSQSSSSLMISRLTSLPPLAAMRRPPTLSSSTGLNSLSSYSTSSTSSSSEPQSLISVVHRVGNLACRLDEHSHQPLSPLD